MIDKIFYLHLPLYLIGLWMSCHKGLKVYGVAVMMAMSILSIFCFSLFILITILGGSLDRMGYFILYLFLGFIGYLNSCKA